MHPFESSVAMAAPSEILEDGCLFLSRPLKHGVVIAGSVQVVYDVNSEDLCRETEAAFKEPQEALVDIWVFASLLVFEEGGGRVLSQGRVLLSHSYGSDKNLEELLILGQGGLGCPDAWRQLGGRSAYNPLKIGGECPTGKVSIKVTLDPLVASLRKGAKIGILLKGTGGIEFEHFPRHVDGTVTKGVGFPSGLCKKGTEKSRILVPVAVSRHKKYKDA